MSFLELIKSAYVNIFSNKLRSGLTMLGIMISVSSVILIHVVGDSLNKTMTNTFSDSNNANFCLVSVVPSSLNHTAVMDKKGNYIIPDKLKFNNKLIEKYCSRFDEKVQPIYESDISSCTVRGKTTGVSMNDVTGVNDSFFVLSFENEIISGRTISAEDMEKNANTAVISDITAEICFGDEDPIGKYIYIRNETGIENQYVVVGVYEYDGITYDTTEEKENFITSDLYICYSKFLHNNRDYVTSMDGQSFLIRDIPDTDKFRQDSYNFFNEYFNDEKWTVEIILMTDEISGIQKILKLLTKVMTLITIVSMFVGGMGIMNVMIVSVNERTREIGIKKALGASSSVIISELLTESALLSLVSAGIGIVLGLLLSVNFISIARIICNYNIRTMNIDVVFSPPITAIFFSMISGVVTGIVFGIYPALKASSMNIIDSIRQD